LFGGLIVTDTAAKVCKTYAGRDPGWSALCDTLEASGRTRPIPPLTWSGDLSDTVMDRICLHLRAKVPAVFGGMTLDEISLMFAGLRDEIRRLCERG
jgi:hypothetical protein